MDELLYKLLEQTPVVIALGLGIFATWKEKKEEIKKAKEERERLLAEAAAERKETHTRFEKMVDQHKTELKELNGYVREREAEHLATLKDIQSCLEELLENSDN